VRLETMEVGDRFRSSRSAGLRKWSLTPKSAFGIYLESCRSRFGTATDQFGLRTEQEFRDAVTRWGKIGSVDPVLLQRRAAAPQIGADTQSTSRSLPIPGGTSDSGDRRQLQRRSALPPVAFRAGFVEITYISFAHALHRAPLKTSPIRARA